MPEAQDLTREECLALVRGGVVGRVAVSTPNGPHIVPVNYSMVDDAIVLRTTPYSTVGTHGRGNVVAFEVDHFDHERQRGWSVVVRGRADPVEDAEARRRIDEMRPPRPWASGQRWLMLRIPVTEVSGRRLGSTWDLQAAMPVWRTG